MGITKGLEGLFGAGTSGWTPDVYEYDRGEIADRSLPAAMAGFRNQMFDAGTNRDIALRALRNQVTGNENSVAQNQLLMGQDRALKNNFAMAAAARGSNIGLARRNALNSNADASANLAGQAALLRAQEQSQAAGQLGQMSQQQQQFYETLANGRQLNDIEAMRQLEFQKGQDVMNRNAIMKGVAINNANQRASNIGGMLSAGAGALGMMFSDKNLKKNITEEETPEKKATKDFASAISFVKPANGPTNMFGGVQNGFDAGQKLGQALFNKQPSEETFAPVFNPGMLAMSDEEEKTGKQKEGKSGDLYGFLDALKAYKYNYKDPKFGEGDHYSVMAQDLEQSPVGKKMVMNTNEGKLVDYNKGLPAMLAAQAQLHERLKRLEGN